jgi:hypothetical protein
MSYIWLLIVLGILTTDHQIVNFTCPLMRSFLLYKFSTSLADIAPNIPRVDDLHRINLPELIKVAVPYISTTTLNHENAKNKHGYPHEYALQYETYNALSWIFQANHEPTIVIPEAKDYYNMEQKRVDILISNSANYCIELGQNMDKNSVLQHIKRLSEYVQALEAVHGAVVNYITKESTEPFTPENQLDAKISVMHFNNRKFYLWNQQLKKFFRMFMFRILNV